MKLWWHENEMEKSSGKHDLESTDRFIGEEKFRRFSALNGDDDDAARMHFVNYAEL
jgi:hypothetical protein